MTFRLALIGLLSLCLGLSNCSKKPEAEPATNSAANTPFDSKRVFRWPNVEPVSLDPAQALDAAAMRILTNTHEGLYIPGHGEGPPRLGAVSIPPTRSEDGLTWTFRLRKDGKWSDGKEVLASHFVEGWRRVVSPDTASPLAEDLHIVKNGAAISKGTLATDTLGIRAVDSHTLEVVLEYPCPNLLQKITQISFLPTRLDHIESKRDTWTSPENWVSNGPYIVTEWAPRERIVLERNPHHSLFESLWFHRSVLLHVENAMAGWNLYREGKLDRVRPLPAELVSQFQREGNPGLHIDATLCSTGIVFQIHHPALQDVRVRKALSMALDRKRLVKHVLNRGDKESATYFPNALQKMAGYTPPEGVPFDPEQARKLLREAGFPKGNGFPEISFLFNSHDINRRVAEGIQASLQEHLGISLLLENVEWKTFLARVNKKDFAMARTSLCGMNDPLDWAEIFKTGGGVNWSGFSDEAFDRDLATARRTIVRRERLQRAMQAEKIILDNALIAPLFSQVNPYLVRPGIRGFEGHPEDIHLLRDLSSE